MTEASLTLEARSGLPDALCVLLAEYPRSGWEADPGFSQLIRFWLDRHMMFRKLVARMTEDGQRFLDGGIDPARYAAGLSRFGSTFVGELHGHHHVEDAHYFPLLSQRDQRLTTGFALLDSDHHALDGHLEAFVERANAVLQVPETERHDPAGAFLEGLERFRPMLMRHLEDEEDLIVPVLLKYGEAGLG